MSIKYFLYNSQNSDTYKLMPEYLLLSDCFILIDAWDCEALITTASDENTIRPARQILYLYYNNNNDDRLTAFDPGQPG